MKGVEVLKNEVLLVGNGDTISCLPESSCSPVEAVSCEPSHFGGVENLEADIIKLLMCWAELKVYCNDKESNEPRGVVVLVLSYLDKPVI